MVDSTKIEAMPSQASESKESNSSELEVRVYGATTGKVYSSGMGSFIREFPAAHSLGFVLAQRNIRAKYRQSMFGMLWAMLPPVVTAFIWIILNKSSVVRVDTPGVPYPLFVITGTMLWTIFSNAVTLPIQTMQANRNILVKVNFPREALIICAFYEVLFSTALSFIVIAAVMIFFQVPLTADALLFIPGSLILLLLGMAVSLLLLPVSLLYKDIQLGLPILLQFFMYLTPVVYALPSNPAVGKLISINPVTPVLTNTRAWLLNLEPSFSFGFFSIIVLVAAFLLIVGIILQRLSMQILIERMGS